MTIKRIIGELLYPRRCPICDCCIPPKELICKKCVSLIRPIEGECCKKCGKSLTDEDRIYCFDCSKKIHYFDRNYALFEYKDIKKSLYRFKYSGRAEYAAFYAYVAYKKLGHVFAGLNVDAIIPVPIHKGRRRERGYNQAEELAKCLSHYINVPVVNDLVIRKKKTLPLKNLSGKERINNLKRAFIIARNDVKLKTIIIVDDIYTTGATFDTLSVVLRATGIEKIYCLTVAVGKGL